MTVDDIDDAMGWPRGTARRRRWQAPERGGLPFADAELGGMALWFRSTFEAWRGTPAARAGRRRVRRSSAGERPSWPELATGDAEDSAEDDMTSSSADPDSEPNAQPDAQPEDETADDEADDTADEEAADTDPEAEADPEATDDAPDTGGRWQPAGVRVRSGYELAVGQQVLAEVQGRWRQVEVSRRDRTSVLVQYQLDDSLLGARVQRVGVDRVLVPDAGQPWL